MYYLRTPIFEPPNLNSHYWGLVSAESELSTQQYLLWQTQVDRELRARLAVLLPHGTHAIMYSFIHCEYSIRNNAQIKARFPKPSLSAH